MKVYVFGSDKDACIELANQLNDKGASAIIAKSGEGLANVAGRIGKAFDAAIMVSDDPIKDAALANKESKVMAAICYNQKTLKAAAEKGVNLFIIEPGVQDELDISDILAKATSPPKQQETKPASGGLGSSIFKGISAQPKQQPPKAKKSHPHGEPNDNSGSAGGEGSISSRIRDIFGIEE